MQKLLANKLRMYKGVQTMLTGNKEKWDAVPTIDKVVQAFELLIKKIEDCNAIASNKRKGETAQKKELRTTLIGRALEISSALYAIMVQTDELSNRAKLNFTKTKLVKRRDLQLVYTCECIAILANERLQLLATAGYTANDLEILNADIKTFAELLPRHRLSVTERKTANTLLKGLFGQTDSLLKNQLDRLMLRYKQSQPLFYSSYQTSRHIINYGVRHSKSKSEETPV